ncbi:efflux RND transporter periplasmic adaptor subunit [Hymenobacter caeli]|uniref:HlyD family secretion protein n=1 Tax=Hymenobacter caeli TaxID=2735894 RepID=A0ABX2FRI2_9BACT|nr:efflux RND transporter periplasmic adaptor subunit [Hymenobacter caeli]NRT19601.1 HlyD family secretion protein [Hymenobacter caeli]
MTPLRPALPLVPLVAAPALVLPAPAALPPAATSPPPGAPAEIPALSEPGWWRRPWPWWTLAFVLAAAAGAWFWLRPSAVAWKYYTAPVESKPLDLGATATGTLAAVRTVAVGTQVSGVISALYADFNSRVKKGQVIAELDKTLLLSALADATAVLDKAQVQTRESQREFERARLLYANKVTARVDYDTALTTYQSALASERSARTQQQRARVNLNFATIAAPIAGVVVARNVDVGQTVAASFNTPTLFTIANDLTRMQVEAAVDEADIGQVKTGQPVRFEVDAYPGRAFQGVVQQIRLQPVVTQSVVTYTVIISTTNADLALLPGLTANLTVGTAHYPAAPTVPASALTFVPPAGYLRAGAGPVPAGALVWVVRGDSLRPVAVRVGATDGVHTQVRGPLRAGEAVATGQDNGPAKSGTGNLMSGMSGGASGGRRGPF